MSTGAVGAGYLQGHAMLNENTTDGNSASYIWLRLPLPGIQYGSFLAKHHGPTVLAKVRAFELSQVMMQPTSINLFNKLLANRGQCDHLPLQVPHVKLWDCPRWLGIQAVPAQIAAKEPQGQDFVRLAAGSLADVTIPYNRCFPTETEMGRVHRNCQGVGWSNMDVNSK